MYENHISNWFLHHELSNLLNDLPIYDYLSIETMLSFCNIIKYKLFNQVYNSLLHLIVKM